MKRRSCIYLGSRAVVLTPNGRSQDLDLNNPQWPEGAGIQGTVCSVYIDGFDFETRIDTTPNAGYFDRRFVMGRMLRKQFNREQWLGVQTLPASKDSKKQKRWLMYGPREVEPLEKLCAVLSGSGVIVRGVYPLPIVLPHVIKMGKTTARAVLHIYFNGIGDCRIVYTQGKEVLFTRLMMQFDCKPDLTEAALQTEIERVKNYLMSQRLLQSSSEVEVLLHTPRLRESVEYEWIAQHQRRIFKPCNIAPGGSLSDWHTHRFQWTSMCASAAMVVSSLALFAASDALSNDASEQLQGLKARIAQEERLTRSTFNELKLPEAFIPVAKDYEAALKTLNSQALDIRGTLTQIAQSTQAAPQVQPTRLGWKWNEGKWMFLLSGQMMVNEVQHIQPAFETFLAQLKKNGIEATPKTKPVTDASDETLKGKVQEVRELGRGEATPRTFELEWTWIPPNT